MADEARRVKRPLVVSSRVASQTVGGSAVTEFELSEEAKRRLSVTPEAAERFHEAYQRSLDYYRGNRTKRDFRNQMLIDGVVAVAAAGLALWRFPPFAVVALVYAWSCGGYTVMWRRTPE